MDLEARVEKQTVWQELSASAKNYPANWVDAMKGFGIPCLASLVGSSVGQYLAAKYWPGNATAANSMAIICGYPLGYSTIFGIELWRNKENYTNLGQLLTIDYWRHPETHTQAKASAKKFKDYVISFLAADYISDPIAFQPPFLMLNTWLTHHSAMNPVARNAISWSTAGLTWVSAMAVAHPVVKVLNEYVNRGAKAAYHGIRKGISHLASADWGPGF
jgi:hypothetical protein